MTVRFYRLHLIIACAVGALFASIPLTGACTQAEEAARKIQHAYEGIRTVRRQFIQKSHVRDLKRTDTYRGEFVLKAQKMRWEYTGDKPQIIYISGDDITIYQKREKQAFSDTVAMDLPLSGTLEEMVTPPHGLKHRILAQTPRETLVAAMRASLSAMERGGTGGCADFREGGPGGVAALRDAARGLSLRPLILGREGGQEAADGLGISSARDVTDLEHQVAEMRRAGKMVAFHAGERDPEDVEAALSFGPDLLIHCTHATESQIRRIADAGIPVAICPRANWRLGVARGRDSAVL